MNSFKDTVTKTVQLFKLTHQDRWNEFKLSFSREQLEDLQVRSTSSVYLIWRSENVNKYLPS